LWRGAGLRHARGSRLAIALAAHEIEPLELVYELGDGLARDTGVGGEVAGARTVLADVAQERGVRGRDV
jgi:hypothetical protein